MQLFGHLVEITISRELFGAFYLLPFMLFFLNKLSVVYE